jgi:hypothetical protein
MRFEPRVTFSIYIIVCKYESFFPNSFSHLLFFLQKFYHEASVVNLLETLMYHEDVCTAFDDQILDLIDYCYRLLTEIIRKIKHEYKQQSDVFSVFKIK